MHGMTTTESRPEAMADVPGVCELPLTRAVVQYRDVHELYHPGGRIQDIGLAVIVEGRYASSARAIDLGSAQVKYLDLTSELVILDWIYDATLSHIRVLDAAGKSGGGPDGGALRRYCFDLALRVLKRRGFSPLTRPTLLRIGFRDLCKDLDLHESAVVRIITGYRSVTRVHLDYDANALVFRSATARAGNLLDGVLKEVFPGLPAGPTGTRDPDGVVSSRVRFGVPVTYGEVLRGLRIMRLGLGRLVARFEPERFKAVAGLVSAFGERSTLDRLDFDVTRADDVGKSPDVAGTGLGATGMAVH